MEMLPAGFPDSSGLTCEAQYLSNTCVSAREASISLRHIWCL